MATSQAFEPDQPPALEGDQHAGGCAIGIGHVVGERPPWPLHGLPERLELAGFAPVEVGPLELEFAGPMPA
jgi:hypothetical protein